MNNYIFFGTGGLLSSTCLNELIVNNLSPAYVIIQNSSPSPYPNLTKELCDVNAIPFSLVETVNDENTLNLLNTLEADFGVVASFGEIFKSQILEVFPIFNVHMGVLPFYRGAYTNFWKIINNDDVYGVTIHKMDKKIDGGESVSIVEKDFKDVVFANDFFIRNYKMAASAILRVIQDFYQDRLEYTPIDISKGKYYRKFKQSDMILDPQEDIINLHKKINRLQFYGNPTIENFSLTESSVLLNTELPVDEFSIIHVNDFSFVLKNKSGILLLKYK